MARRKPLPAPRRSAKRPAANKPADGLEADFARAMAGHDGPPWAVAVSGGGDSLALIHLLRGFAEARGLAEVESSGQLGHAETVVRMACEKVENGHHTLGGR